LSSFGRLLSRPDENFDEMYVFVRRRCRRFVKPITKRHDALHQRRGVAIRRT